MQLIKTPFRKNKLLTKLNKIFNSPAKNISDREKSRNSLKGGKGQVDVAQSAGQKESLWTVWTVMRLVWLGSQK